MTLPPSMKAFDISGTSVKIDVAAIEWPANATALVYDGRADALVCRTTDPDESNGSATTSEIRIKCGRDQVIGTSLAVSRNDPIRMRSHEPYNLLVRSSRTRFLIPHFILFPLLFFRYPSDVAAVQHEGIQHL